METIGVEAIVNGLSGFMSGMDSMDKKIQSLVPTSSLLSGAFDFLGGVITNLADGAVHILEYALGGLLKDAIESVIGSIKDLISGSLEIADTFQALQIRLNQLNMNDFIASGDDMTTAMKKASEATKDELDWIQKLAFATPFEMEDITNVYGMARAFGYTDQGARDLTTTLGDFVFGMGLTGDAANSIVKQFGQMNSTGKIMQKNLNALAQGGLVPVTKLLDIMKEKTGLSDSAFKAFLLTADGVTMFKATFAKYVEENFAGAGERANRTFKNATITIKEFFQTLLAGNVVTPIIAQIGEAIAKMNDALQARLPDIQAAFGRIGTVISDIVGALVDTNAINGFVDGFVNALDGVASWLEAHKTDIVKFFKDAIDKVKEFIGWLFGKNNQKGAIQNFFDWLKSPELKSVITQITTMLGKMFDFIFGKKGSGGGALQSILDIATALAPVLPPLLDLLGAIGDVIMTAFGVKPDTSFSDFITQTLIPDIQNLTKWINDNKDTLAFLVQGFILGALTMMAFSAAMSIGIGVLTNLVAAILGLSIIAVVAFDIWLVKTTISFSLWAANTWATMTNWATDTWATIILWGINTKNTISNWSSSAWADIVLFGIRSKNTLSNWSSSAWADIILFGINSKNSISTWAEDTWTVIILWGINTYNSITTWATNAWTSIILWGANVLQSIRTWSYNSATVFTTWFSNIITQIGTWASSALGKFEQWATQVANSIKSKMEAFDWFAIGQNIVQTIINGLLSIAMPTLTPNVSTPNTSIPSTGSPFAATGTHGLQTVPEGFNNDTFPVFMTSGERYMVIPKGGQMSSSSAGDTVNSSQQIINNFNLAINSSARTEPIVQDFNMMRSMST
jgi:tape measure domain-containing protein